MTTWATTSRHSSSFDDNLSSKSDSGIFFDTYTDDNEYSSTSYVANWDAQTFTPTTNYTLTGAQLKLWKYGAPTTDVTVSIRTTSSGLPTGSDLSTNTIPISSLSTNPNGAYIQLSLPAINLTSGTTYAIVLRISGGDASNNVLWKGSNVGVYSGGKQCFSTNSGSSWGSNSGVDHDFKTIGRSYFSGTTRHASTFTIQSKS